MKKNYSEKQSVQESEYSIPYHYIPTVDESGFSQTMFWSWGMRYMGGIELVLSELQKVRFSSLLDVGCGDGRFLREVAAKHPDVQLLGIDYSQKAIAFARAFNPDIEYACLDITTDKPDRRFDVITMIEVLEHIPPEMIPDFLQAVTDYLAPDGKLILTVPHTNKRVQDKHYQHFSSTTLRQTLEPFFTVERIMPFDRKSRVNALLLRLMGYIGTNYVVTNKMLNTFVYKRVLDGCLQEQREDDCGRLMLVGKRLALAGDAGKR